MKIIVFSYNVPRHDNSSGERRFFSILEMLARDHEVDLCVSRWNKKPVKPERERYINLLKSRNINVLPFEFDCVRKSLQRKKYDIGFFEFFWIAEDNILQFSKYQPGAVTIVDSVDVHYAREESQAKLGQIPWKKALRTKERELFIYRNVDIVLAVSEEDVALLREEKMKCRILLLPNIVPTVNRLESERKPVAVFIGSYGWHPNVDAVKWFTDRVWPMVYENNHKASLQIIGSSPTPEILALKSVPGVEVCGFVPETSPYLHKAAVSIAPLRYGGGMKGKVNEALAHGVPVVSTTFGAQGFNAKNGSEMIITDDLKEFADSILLLFNDPQLQKKIGLAGQLLNERYCSPQFVVIKLDNMIQLAVKLLSEKRNNILKWKIFRWKIYTRKTLFIAVLRYIKQRFFNK
jgi:O-antigen biosynthesis protein